MGAPPVILHRSLRVNILIWVLNKDSTSEQARRVAEDSFRWVCQCCKAAHTPWGKLMHRLWNLPAGHPDCIRP